MLYLNIRSTPARIGVEVNRGRLEIHSPRGRWNVQHEYGKCNLSVGKATLELNSKPFYEKVGKYMPDAFYRKYAQEGRQGVQDGIRRRMREAEMFNQDGARSNVIAQIGKQAVAKSYELVVGLTITPKADITVHRGELQGKNDVGSLEQKYEPRPVQIDYTPTAVHTYLKQKADLRMWVTEGKYDIYA